MRNARPETSAAAQVVLSGMVLNRVSARRADPAWVAEQRQLPTARLLAASRDSVLIEDYRLARRRPPPEWLAEDPADSILLGLDGEAPVFAVDLDALGEEARAQLERGTRLMALRDAGTLLPRPEAGLAGYLVALLNWHRRHRFCANCGTASDNAEAGYSRRCPNCGATHFPRTDPAVIMLVEHDQHVLLGRRPGWPEGRYSVLAGFVSPGETLEEAVIREVREESGIEARDPEFVASQPWPFPSSLMLGFTAHADGGEPRALDHELEDVRWFELDAVTASLNGGDGGFKLPPPVSIAHVLIVRWVEANRRLR